MQQDIYPDAAALMEADAEQEAATADTRPAFAPHSILLADYPLDYPF
jgi:hypothetical protein